MEPFVARLAGAEAIGSSNEGIGDSAVLGNATASGLGRGRSRPTTTGGSALLRYRVAVMAPAMAPRADARSSVPTTIHVRVARLQGRLFCPASSAPAASQRRLAALPFPLRPEREGRRGAPGVPPA